MDNENIENENSTNNEAEGNENEAEFVKVPKKDYDSLNQTLGSLKRQVKDLSKPKDEPKETANQTKPDVSRLIERLENMSLRQAGITHKDDIDLAKTYSKKWNMDIDELVLDEDFQVKLEKARVQRSNVEATSGVKGSGGTTQAKLTPEYWLAKGTPPTREDVPDRKTRMTINRAFIDGAKNKKKFYND